MVQPYSMLPLIRADPRNVTLPNGMVVLEQATGTARKMDLWWVDIMQCLVAPRAQQLKARREYGDDTIIMRVQIPGIEKIAAGVAKRGKYGASDARRQRGQAGPVPADDSQQP
jgi:hypothetical protein